MLTARSFFERISDKLTGSLRLSDINSDYVSFPFLFIYLALKVYISE